MHWLYVGLFGLAGVYARYGMTLAATRIHAGLPLGTFSVNIIGSFLAGLAYAWGVEREWLSPELRRGVMFGFLGGFTTFSSYCLESARMSETEGEGTLSLIYLLISPAVGFGVAKAALWLGRTA